MIIDCHTHHSAPAPEAVISVSPEEFNPIEGQVYSVGIHPWNTEEAPAAETLKRLEEIARHPQVVAIGECGIDLLKGGRMFRQLQVFSWQVKLSEAVGKPLVIHQVKSQDIILSVRKDLKPTQPWIIHGFRGKAPMAEVFLKAGCYLSFGEKFNVRAVGSIPSDRILCETDESDKPIAEIIAALNEAAGKDLTEALRDNATRLFSPQQHD